MRSIIVTVLPDYDGKIILGRQRENEARQLVFQCEKFAEFFGKGSPVIAYKRKVDEAPYLLIAEKTGECEWTCDIRNTDTEYTGHGQIEVRWQLASGGLGKSATYTTIVMPSITDNEQEPPEPLEEWYDAMIRYIQNINADTTRMALLYAQEAQKQATTATNKAKEASTAATNAKGYRDAAGTSRDAAEKAQLRAETAKTGAEKALKELKDGIASGDFDGVGVEKVEQIKTGTGSDAVNTVRVTLTDGRKYDFDIKNGSKGDAGYTPVKGKDYFDGAQGVSITSVKQVSSSSSDGGVNIIRVTLSNGQTSEFNVYNGTRGPQGEKGVGVRSIVQTKVADESEGVNVITATLTDGTKTTFNIKNGQRGEQGLRGPKGETGDRGLTGATGERGEKGDTGDTYTLTAEDRSEIGAIATEELHGEVNAIKEDYSKLDIRVTDLENEPKVPEDLVAEVKQNTKVNDEQNRRLTNLEYASKGVLYREDENESEDYQKDIPSDVMPYGTFDKIGGKTIVYNQMIGENYPKAVSGEFYEQTVEDKAESFDVDVLNGKTVVWNQISKMTCYSASGVITKVETEKFVFNGTCTTSNQLSGTNLSLKANHKYFVQYVYENFPVIVSETYAFHLYDAVTTKSYFFASDKELSGTSGRRSGVFTAISDTNACNIRFRCQDGATYTNFILYRPTVVDLTVMFGSGNEPDLDTCKRIFSADYYPYSEPKLANVNAENVVSKDHDGTELSAVSASDLIHKYFPTGMKSAGSVSDELDLKTGKAIQRVGALDLGNYSWGYNPSYGFNTTIPQNMIKYALYSAKANLLCSIYSTDTYANTAVKAHDMSIAYGGWNNDSRIMLITNNAYTDQVLFKQAMNGVILYYELETPIETPIDPSDLAILRSIPCEQGGTITFENALDIALPIEVEETMNLTEWTQPLDSSHKYNHNGNLVTGVSNVEAKKGDTLVDMTRAGLEDLSAYVNVGTEKNDGELVSADVVEMVSSGRNMFDENKIDTVALIGTNVLRKGVNLYLPKGTYKLSSVLKSSASAYARYSDGKGGFISAVEIKNSPSVTIVDNYPLQIYGPANDLYSEVVIKNEKVKVERGTVATEYEPYWENTKDIATVINKYFPDGMRSAGSVADMFDVENGVAVQNVGVADLGEYYDYGKFDNGTIKMWTKSINTFYNMKNVGSGVTPNVVHGEFKTLPYNTIPTSSYMLASKCIAQATAGNLCVKTGSLDIRPSGVMYYEYENPIITSLDPEDIELLKTLEVEAGGSLTFVQSNENFRIPVPNKETFLVKTGGAS